MAEDYGDPFLQRMQRERRTTNTEVVKHVKSREVLSDEHVKRLERVERLLEKFANSQEFVLPRAFQELVERVRDLENEPRDITPNGGVSQSDIQLVAQAARDATEAAVGLLQTLSVVEKRLDALEARVSSMPRVMLEEYVSSLKDIQSRNA